jgi:hypothetical protein
MSKMRSLTRSFCVASLVGSAIAALGGCGESENALETTTTTVSVEREQSPSQPKGEPVKPPSLSEQAEAVGHTDPKFTLAVYGHVMKRSADERARLKALIEGADWASKGAKAPTSTAAPDSGATSNGSDSAYLQQF